MLEDNSGGSLCILKLKIWYKILRISNDAALIYQNHPHLNKVKAFKPVITIAGLSTRCETLDNPFEHCSAANHSTPRDSFAGETSQSATYQNDADIWTTDKRDPPPFEFRGNSGLKIPNDVKSPGNFFELFLTESFLNKIVQKTNRYADQQIAKFPVLRFSGLRDWKDTSARELRVFFGLFMHTGTITLPSVAHY
uniref:PiggyBac transposable element-derived protein domain-containing protein n=1 Tax=Glossina palpalis gambiensis TaxID=67801 RepID=A0A1B0C2S4_9MUSC